MDERMSNVRPPRKTICYCNKLPQLSHELNQSLLIIRAYVKGCSERIKKDYLDLEQLSIALNAINEQITTMANTIHALI